jgi:hypothetical protein
MACGSNPQSRAGTADTIDKLNQPPKLSTRLLWLAEMPSFSAIARFGFASPLGSAHFGLSSCSERGGHHQAPVVGKYGKAELCVKEGDQALLCSGREGASGATGKRGATGEALFLHAAWNSNCKHGNLSMRLQP